MTERQIRGLSRRCPDWNPPPNDNKFYKALAGLTGPIGSGPARKSSKPILGVREAYYEARRLGIEVEREELLRNPRMSAYADGSYPICVGVYWALDETVPEGADPEDWKKVQAELAEAGL